MNCELRFMTELPFTLNLPNGTYPVRMERNGQVVDVPIQIEQDQWRLNFTDKPTADDKFAVGTKDELERLIPSVPADWPKTWEQLRTVVRASFVEDLNPTGEELAAVTAQEIDSAIIAYEIRQNPGPGADVQARVCISPLNSGDRQLWAEKIIIDRTFYRLRHKKDLLLDAINRLISHYRVLTGDHFVERCTDHTLRLIHGEEIVDGEPYDMLYIVGKVPSWFKPMWNPMPEHQVVALRAALQGTDEPNGPLELLSVARNQLEKGETRAAIIDASAGLEAAVAQKITEKMRKAGKTSTDIANYLQTTQLDFPKRCSRQLAAWTRPSPSLVKQVHLWGPVQNARKQYRHAVAHGDLRPALGDAETAVAAFEAAVRFVLGL